MNAVLAPGAGCALCAAEACTAGAAVRTALAPGALRGLRAAVALPAAAALAASGAVSAPDASDAVGAPAAPVAPKATGAVAAVHAASAAGAVGAAAAPDAVGAPDAACRFERGSRSLLDGEVGDAPAVAGSVDPVIAIRANDLGGVDGGGGGGVLHAVVLLHFPPCGGDRTRQHGEVPRAWVGGWDTAPACGHAPGHAAPTEICRAPRASRGCPRGTPRLRRRGETPPCSLGSPPRHRGRFLPRGLAAPRR